MQIYIVQRYYWRMFVVNNLDQLLYLEKGSVTEAIRNEKLNKFNILSVVAI